ncbi:hypothetical protein BJ165DRAFT_232050 [Panaeolus papilionaceus]|nr:hypothetical protein BJ165DRAFT_232050 [Panaeolus papilionaceus]
MSALSFQLVLFRTFILHHHIAKICSPRFCRVIIYLSKSSRSYLTYRTQSRHTLSTYIDQIKVRYITKQEMQAARNLDERTSSASFIS